MTVIRKNKEQLPQPEMDEQRDPQQPFIDFGDVNNIILNTLPIKNHGERSSFTIHKGALAEAQEPTAQPFVKWVGGKRNFYCCCLEFNYWYYTRKSGEVECFDSALKYSDRRLMHKVFTAKQ